MCNCYYGEGEHLGEEHLRDECFGNDFCEEEESDFECEYDDSDVWDAMTDGMYGSYPGGYVDYDQFGFD